MSVFKNRAGFRLRRRTKARLTRGASTIEALRELGRQEQEIAASRAVLPAKREAGEDVGTRAENIIWMFASGRTGSSWLGSTVDALPDSKPSERRRTKHPELFETSNSFVPETDTSPPNSHLSSPLGFKLGGQPLYILPASEREPYKMSDTPSWSRL